MLKMLVTDVCYEVSTKNNGELLVHLTGRNEKGCREHRVLVKTKPYFYINKNDYDFSSSLKHIVGRENTTDKTLDGKEVMKIYVDYPFNVPNLRENFTDSYEADVPYADRIRIDYGIKQGIKLKTDRKRISKNDIMGIDEGLIKPCIWYIDMEMDDREGLPSAFHAVSSIYSIAIYDNYNKTFYLLTTANYDVKDIRHYLREYENKNRGMQEQARKFFGELHHNCKILRFSDERRMLKKVIDLFLKRQPDIVTGWNVKFDMSYLLSRMKKIGIDIRQLSEIGVCKARDGKVKGRVNFDLMRGYENLHEGVLESRALEVISRLELGIGKMRRKKVWMEYNNNPSKLCVYNMIDVILCLALDKKVGIFDYFLTLQSVVGCSLRDLTFSSKCIDMYLLHSLHDKYVLPSRRRRVESKKVKGASVYKPESGLHKNIAGLDLKSLYPNIMRTLNISPETKIKDGRYKTLSEARFRDKKQGIGILPRILENMIKKRNEFKSKRDGCDYNSDEWRKYNNYQRSFKFLTNAIYGVLGFKRFRLYDTDCSSAITAVGRGIIKYTKEIIEKKGYKVMASDTDSVFVNVGEGGNSKSLNSMIDEGKDLVAYLNGKYDEFAKKLNCDKHYFSIKFEKLWEKILFTTKKRYAGLVKWDEGKKVNSIVIRGFEYRRSDAPEITKKLQKEFFNKLFRDGLVSAKNVVLSLIRNIKNDNIALSELGVPSRITKPISKYKVTPIHLRAALYSNNKLGCDFKVGDRLKYYYVKSLGTNVIALGFDVDNMPKGYELDKSEMIRVCIKQPLKWIIDELGWETELYNKTESAKLDEWI